MARLTRTQQVQANRGRILVSARDHFERLGYHGASVDAIAEDAGFSKGAIYSQFGSKDDLMLAVLEASIAERKEETERFVAGSSGPSIEDMMRYTFAVSARGAAWQAALAEFRIHAWRRPDLNERYVSLHERTIEAVTATLATVLERLGEPGQDSTRDMAVALLALNTGLVIESLVADGSDLACCAESLVRLLRQTSAGAEGADR